MEKVEAKQVSHNHMHRYVRVVIVDGRIFDGFVENVDDEHLHLAVPVGHEMYCDQVESISHHPNENMSPMGGYGSNPQLQPVGHGMQQVHGNPSFGSSGYPGIDVRAFVPGYYPGAPGFGYNPYGRRRFNRLLLPLAALATISVLPFF